jgi:hypothetical protein
MARRSESLRLPWLLAVLLAATAGVPAQTIDLKGWTPADTEAPREGVLSAADKTLLGDLPLRRYIQVPRHFEGQDLSSGSIFWKPGDGSNPARCRLSDSSPSCRATAQAVLGPADCFIQELSWFSGGAR